RRWTAAAIAWSASSTPVYAIDSPRPAPRAAWARAVRRATRCCCPVCARPVWRTPWPGWSACCARRICMRPAEWKHDSRILVVRLDNLGDMVMLGPSLRTLKKALPHASLTLLASPNGSQVAPLLPWVDEVIVHRASWQELNGAGAPAREADATPGGLLATDPCRLPHSVVRELALADKLRARRFDAACIFTSFTQSPWPPAYLCYLAGIP